MADVVQETIDEANKQIVDDSGLRLAHGAEGRIVRPTRTRSRRRLRRAAISPSRSSWKCCRNSRSASFADIALERPVAEVADERDRRRRRSAWPTDRRNFAERPRRARRGEGRQRHGRFRRQDRRRGVRGRDERGHRGDPRLQQPSFPASRMQLDRRGAGEERTVEATLPGRLRERDARRARTRSST